MKVFGKQKIDVEVEITESELSSLLLRHVIEQYLGGDFDDAGCDWMTSPDGKQVCIGGLDWVAIEDEKAVALVDASNIIHFGYKLIAE